MIRLKTRCGQSMMEYMMLVVIVIGVLVSMAAYSKRAISGRYKQAVDGIGDQYDPRTATGNVTSTLAGDSVTLISVTDAAPLSGFYTSRTDDTDVVETTVGNLTVGTSN